MLAPPTEINQRIVVSIQLQQIWYHLALQATESRSRPQRFTGGAYGVDRNMRSEIYPRPGYRLESPAVPIGRKRASEWAPLGRMAVVDHQTTATAFDDHLDQLTPSHIPGEADLSALTTGPPSVSPSKLLIVQTWSRLFQAIIVDDHLPPAVGVTRDNGARQVIQPLAANDHHWLRLAQCSSGLTAGPAAIPYVPQILRPADLFRQISGPRS